MLYSLGFNNSSLLPNVSLAGLHTGLSSKQGWGMLHLEQTPYNLVLRSFPWEMWPWISSGRCFPFPSTGVSDREHCHRVCRACFLAGSPQVPKLKGSGLGWSISSVGGAQKWPWRSAFCTWGPWGLNLAGERHFKHPPPFRIFTDTLCPSAEEPNFPHESPAFPWAGWCTSLTPLQALPQVFPRQIYTPGSSQPQTKPTISFMPSPQTLDPLLQFIRQAWSDQESEVYHSRLIWDMCKGQRVWTMENLADFFCLCLRQSGSKIRCCAAKTQFPSPPGQWLLFSLFLICWAVAYKASNWEWAGNVRLPFPAFAPAHAGYFKRRFLWRRSNELCESNVFTAVENWSLAEKGSTETLKTM